MANFWDVCKSSDSGCGGVNLKGHGDPSSPGGYRQDYSVPLDKGTPVQSPVDGIVLPQHSDGYMSLFGRQDWGGETDILTNLPEYSDKPVVVTILHFDTLDKNLQPGAVVAQGDVLGTSGGQTSGGNWPSSPKDSTGPHMGIAVRPYDTWHGYWDPTKLMTQLIGGQHPSSYPTVEQMRNNVFSGLNTYQYNAAPGGGPSNPFDALGNIASFITSGSNWLRLGKIIAGGLLIVVGLLATIFGPAAPEIAGAAVAATGNPEAAQVVRATLGGKGRAKIARAAIAGAGTAKGTKVVRRQQAQAQAQAEERVAEKTAEKTAARVAPTPSARVHGPAPGGARRVPPGTGPGGSYTLAEQRRYFGGKRRYAGPTMSQLANQAPARPARHSGGLRAPSAANVAAMQRKQERQAREAATEAQRQKLKDYTRGSRENLGRE